MSGRLAAIADTTRHCFLLGLFEGDAASGHPESTL